MPAAGSVPSTSASLRGGVQRNQSAHRRLNTTNTGTMVPQCRPGYIDTSGGRAHYWSCAFYCDGGPYYAKASCMCACLTPEQAANEIYQATTTVGGVGWAVTVTASTGLTTEPYVPVEKMPIGDLGQEAGGPPQVDGYVSGPDLPGNAPPEDLEGEEEPTGLSITVIIVIAASMLCLIAVALFGCAFKTGALRRGSARVEDFKFVETPAISSGGNEILSSRASSRNSTTSHTLLEIQEARTGSRRSSNASVRSQQDMKSGAFYDSGISSTTASQMLCSSKDIPPSGPFPDSIPRGGPFPDTAWAHEPYDDDERGLTGPRASSRMSVHSTQGNRLQMPQELGSRRSSKTSVDSMTASHLIGPSHLNTTHLVPDQRGASRQSAGHVSVGSHHLSPSVRECSRTSANSHHSQETGRKPSKSPRELGARRDSRTSTASVRTAGSARR